MFIFFQFYAYDYLVYQLLSEYLFQFFKLIAWYIVVLMDSFQSLLLLRVDFFFKNAYYL